MLFLPRHATSFSKMLPQARLLAGSGDLQPVMVLADPRTYGYADQCRREELAVLDLRKVDGGGADPVAAADRAWTAVADRAPGPLRRWLRGDRLAHGLIVGTWRRRRVMRAYAAQKDFWRGLLAGLAPVAIVMPGDRELGFVPPVLAAAGDLGIPRVISVLNIPTIDSVAASRRDQPRFAVDPQALPPLRNLWAAQRHPDQVATTPHGRQLFSTGWLISALDALGMLSARPWTQGGGNSDHILLDGPRKKRRFQNLGAPEPKLELIGELPHDALHRVYRRRRDLRHELCASHGLDPDRPLYIFAVPIFAEHNLLPWDVHLRELRRFATTFADHSTNVLCSLHPKSTRDTYRFLVDDFGFHIADHPLSDILPAGDALVCGNSSTIDWAILCRMPVVDMDYAHLRDAAFADCPGVLQVQTVETFADALRRVDTEGDILRAAQDATARDLALFDGQAADRMLAFFRRLAAAREATRSA